MAGYHDRIAPPVCLGLNAKERREYSITEALRGMMFLGEGKPVPPCLALDVHRSLERLLGRSSPGLLIPILDLAWGRSLQTSQQHLGGSVVAQNLSSDWISALRNRLVIAQCGAKFLTDLSANIDIPRQSGTATVFWVSEGGTIPESNLTLDMISLRPKDVGVLTSVTRRMLMQSSLDVEALIREDLLSCVAEAIDDACINGSGVNNQPLGLLHHPDITEIPIGANGGALDWGHLVQMETEVAVDNADTGTCHYLTNARVRGKLKTTPKVTGQNVFLWQDELNALSNQMTGTVNGYVALTSNILKSDRNKGSAAGLSSIVFGDFSQLMIAQWGTIEVLPNPYGAGYPSGSNQMRVMATIDVAPRRPECFCRIVDVATA